MTWPPAYNADKERKDLLLPVKIVLFPFSVKRSCIYC